jgi:hypothetical protein
MDPNAILRIIELSLQIWLEILKSMPDDQKAAAWERHQKFVEFWQKLIPNQP